MPTTGAPWGVPYPTPDDDPDVPDDLMKLANHLHYLFGNNATAIAALMPKAGGAFSGKIQAPAAAPGDAGTTVVNLDNLNFALGFKVNAANPQFSSMNSAGNSPGSPYRYLYWSDPALGGSGFMRSGAVAPTVRLVEDSADPVEPRVATGGIPTVRTFVDEDGETRLGISMSDVAEVALQRNPDGDVIGVDIIQLAMIAFAEIASLRADVEHLKGEQA